MPLFSEGVHVLFQKYPHHLVIKWIEHKDHALLELTQIILGGIGMQELNVVLRKFRFVFIGLSNKLGIKINSNDFFESLESRRIKTYLAFAASDVDKSLRTNFKTRTLLY